MNICTRILICLAVIAVLAAQSCAAPTPFMISGWVNDTNGGHVNNPNLTIRNLNTSETFVVETNASSNYYQVVTSSLNVSAGNVSNFSANGGTPTNHAVTSDETDAGVFEYNITIESSAELDLNVSEISINPSCGAGVLRANTTNEICAKIVNDGTAAAGQFNVSFVVTGSPGGYSKEVTVTGLGAGNNTTVCMTDYQPTSPGAVTISVTADCNLAVGESDEGNNSMVGSATVYNSGYMGKRLTGGEDIVLVTKEVGNIDLRYAVCNATTYVNATGTHDFGSGKTYLSGTTYPNWTEYRARWDKDPQLPIPSGETIRKATLYVYYTTSYYPVPDFNVSFNGMNCTMADAVHRADVKGWPSTSAYGNAPSGMLTYDVASGFDNTTNTMVVYNLKEPGPDKVTLQGAVLAVVYEHGSEPERIIYINEGFDLLASTSYSCCTPDEATAYADFLNVPNPTLFVNATLVTISTGATKGAGMNKLFFNGGEWDGGLKNGTFPTEEGWAPPAAASYMDITANETDVLGSLLEGNNTARFQDSGDLLCMANAFLKLEKGGGLKPELHHINVTPTSWTMNVTESVNFTATGFDQNNVEIHGLVFAWSRSDEPVGNFTWVNDTTVNFTAEQVGVTHITASNGSVTSDSVQVTVNDGTNTTPPAPATLTNTTSNYWVNYTWTAGGGGVTDGYNVSMNEGWYNRTETSLNSDVGAGNWANITVWAWNNTGSGNMSATNVSDEVQALAEPADTTDPAVNTVTLNNTTPNTGDTILVSVNATDDVAVTTVTADGVSLTSQGGNIWNGTITAEEGTNYVNVSAEDAAGNTGWNNSTSYTATTTAADTTGGGGGGGTYPPGWFGTPTPTVTATKAPTATPTATDAPPGDKVTPAPTKRPDAAKTATPAAEGTTAETAKNGAPGFTMIFAIAGVLAVAYAMMRRRG